jgi:hypothetical protein
MPSVLVTSHYLRGFINYVNNEVFRELKSESFSDNFLNNIFRYECEESFTTLNVDIRNHQNLLDSLEQYVKGDLLEGANAYHCEKCNKKV